MIPRFSQWGVFTHSHYKDDSVFQRALSIPIPIISGSYLRPVMALINHLCLNPVGLSDSLFSVRSPSAQSMQPITYYHFSKFLAKVVTALGLDKRAYSQQSFAMAALHLSLLCSCRSYQASRRLEQRCVLSLFRDVSSTKTQCS